MFVESKISQSDEKFWLNCNHGNYLPLHTLGSDHWKRQTVVYGGITERIIGSSAVHLQAHVRSPSSQLSLR